MDERIYVFDTTIISGLLRKDRGGLLERIRRDQTNVLVLSEPVIYEVERGLEYKQATRQLQRFQEEIIPLFNAVSAQLTDWRVASRLWAFARRNGNQLSDIDLLLAAIALRLGGIIVTDDGDFAYLPVTTENWLQNGNVKE